MFAHHQLCLLLEILFIFFFFLKLKPINSYMTQSHKTISEIVYNSDFIMYLFKWVSGLIGTPSNFPILL